MQRSGQHTRDLRRPTDASYFFFPVINAVRFGCVISSNDLGAQSTSSLRPRVCLDGAGACNHAAVGDFDGQSIGSLTELVPNL